MREQTRAAVAAQAAAAHVTAYSMQAKPNTRADQRASRADASGGISGGFSSTRDSAQDASGAQQLNTRAGLMQAGLERATAAEATAAAHVTVCARTWGSTPHHESRSKARRAEASNRSTHDSVCVQAELNTAATVAHAQCALHEQGPIAHSQATAATAGAGGRRRSARSGAPDMVRRNEREEQGSMSRNEEV